MTGPTRHANTKILVKALISGAQGKEGKKRQLLIFRGSMDLIIFV
jgi:hypothetical protein